jgi:glyoxylase-like metal-dependent hydrolase (beta-lactamase superfamily II)
MISEIEKNFYRISLRMPYRLRHVNAYLFAHDKELALFDTGLNMSGSYETLEKDLIDAGLDINNIRHVFLTHVHTDHCGIAGLLQKNTGAKIYLSRTAFEEYQHFRQPDSAIKQLRNFYSRQGMSPQQIDLVIEEYKYIRNIITEFNTDSYLQDNESLEFGDWTFEVIFTPGHAAGHVCFSSEKKDSCWLVIIFCLLSRRFLALIYLMKVFVHWRPIWIRSAILKNCPSPLFIRDTVIPLLI